MSRAIVSNNVSSRLFESKALINFKTVLNHSCIRFVAYIIDHSEAYTLAALGSWTEFWVEYYIFEGQKFRIYCICGGLLLIVAGQVSCWSICFMSIRKGLMKDESWKVTRIRRS
jgi:hypothetical protein